MTAEQVDPDPAEDDGTVTVPLGYGLCAVYTLRPKPEPRPEPEPWPGNEPPPWGPVGFPEGYTPEPWEQAELDYYQQQRRQAP